MIISSDFDGVIADTYSLLDDGVLLETILSGNADVTQIRPMSQNMINLLNDNQISIIITARDFLEPVYKWIAHYAPEYEGHIQGITLFDNSKAKACTIYGVDIFIDDDNDWITEINMVGITALHFIRDIHIDPYILISRFISKTDSLSLLEKL